MPLTEKQIARHHELEKKAKTFISNDEMGEHLSLRNERFLDLAVKNRNKEEQEEFLRIQRQILFGAAQDPKLSQKIGLGIDQKSSAEDIRKIIAEKINELKDKMQTLLLTLSKTYLRN